MRTVIFRIKGSIVVTFLLLWIFVIPTTASAQSQDFSLSVTPPFFQMTITPGEQWSSFIKLVNVNNFPITLYASAVNFEANRNENGKGKFTPLLSQDPEYKSTSLAGWIDVTGDPITIGAGDTVRLPFSINPPDNAPPGGHYAAILIGNQPVIDPTEGSGIAVSSLISSLIFARVQGDVIEAGDIREFATEQIFYQEPEASFSIRFENTGNVHLLPQGDITIYNMWGKKRGIVPVNQKTTFGNVLPNTVRKFDFVWRGEGSPLEIGRYRAVTTLSYGNDQRRNISAATAFWVVPFVPVLSILGTILLLGLSIVWFIRLYIKRALSNEARALGYKSAKLETHKMPKKTRALTQPLVDGVMDLRNITLEEGSNERRLSFPGFLKKYRLFFLFLLVVIAGIILLRLFFAEVLISERAFEIQVDSELSVPFSTE